MTITWILNFSKEEPPIGSFFDDYWKASLANDRELTEEDRWFHCTDCTLPTLNYPQVLKTARQLTTDLSEEEKKLIPAAVKEAKELKVICMGDITDAITVSRLHIWTAQLRQALLQTAWTHIHSIHFYALLWRPNTAGIEPGISKETRGFLNELASLESLDINNRPFHKVLFFESSVVKAEKANTFRTMQMAALQIALGDNNLLGNLSDEKAVFLNACSTGVFYEAKVQNEQEGYMLGNLLLDKFCHSRKADFYDEKEAIEYVDQKNADFLEKISPDNMANMMTTDHPEISSNLYASEEFTTAGSWGLVYKNIWQNFFCTKLGGFKVRMINNISWELNLYTADFMAKVVSNQEKYINNEKDKLEEKVFAIYAKDSRMKHIGIEQGRKVLKRFQERIAQVANRISSVSIDTFSLPEKLRNAFSQAKNDHPGEKTTEEVMAVLETKLRTLPAFNLALAVRGLVLGALLGFITFSYTMQMSPALHLGLTGLAATLPLVAALAKFLSHVRRINALKDQYIACRLEDMRKKLEDFVVSQMKKTYEEFEFYLDWIEKNKLSYLAQSLSVIAPADFTFEQSKSFQPLLNYNIAMRTGDASTGNPLIPVKPVNAPQDDEDKWRVSGTFGKSPLLFSTPANRINVNGELKSLFDLMGANGDRYCQALCQKLMDEQATITSELEKVVEFGATKISATKLLLLDVSGSMEGQALADLKGAVSELQLSAAVEWIAFSDDVVACSFEGADIDSLEAKGGTCYVPAIMKAREYLISNYADQLILISDGCPFETFTAIISAANGLGHAINTITIGSSAASIMKQIADSTGGTQYIVNDASEIKDNTKQIFEKLQAAEGGTFTFYEMMRKCRVDGCAKALADFARHQAEKDQVNRIADIITHYGNEQGIIEWVRATKPSCHISQAAQPGSTAVSMMVADGKEKLSLQKLEDKLEAWQIPVRADRPASDIDMMALLFAYESTPLCQLLWACFPDNDKTINDREGMKATMNEGWPLINIYGKEI